MKEYVSYVLSFFCIVAVVLSGFVYVSSFFFFRLSVNFTVKKMGRGMGALKEQTGDKNKQLKSEWLKYRVESQKRNRLARFK